jgi:sec-independent protein translocase protein TatA
MPNLGPWEITLIVLLALLLFGSKKLPELAKNIGETIRELKNSLRSDDKK